MLHSNFLNANFFCVVVLNTAMELLCQLGLTASNGKCCYILLHAATKSSFCSLFRHTWAKGSLKNCCEAKTEAAIFKCWLHAFSTTVSEEIVAWKCWKFRMIHKWNLPLALSCTACFRLKLCTNICKSKIKALISPAEEQLNWCGNIYELVAGLSTAELIREHCLYAMSRRESNIWLEFLCQCCSPGVPKECVKDGATCIVGCCYFSVRFTSCAALRAPSESFKDNVRLPPGNFSAFCIVFSYSFLFFALNKWLYSANLFPRLRVDF